MKADHFVETKSQNRAPPPLLFIPLTSPPPPKITQRENNIVCIYNYVNMSNRVSIVKTDFGWSEEWLQEVIIVQKALLYIYKMEKTPKKY